MKYTTIRIERETKQDIDRIAAKILLDSGEELDAAGVVRKMTDFFLSAVFSERKGNEHVHTPTTR